MGCGREAIVIASMGAAIEPIAEPLVKRSAGEGSTAWVALAKQLQLNQWELPTGQTV